MGLLDGMLGGMGGMQDNPFAQYKQMQANPFTRQIPGTEYLDGMGQGQMGGMPSLNGGQLPQGEGVVPTDFAGTAPGLPNLPEDMQGFGFGQSAPQMNINNNLRQNLIQQLISQIMQGGIGQMGGGMGGQGNFGGIMGGGF